MTYVYIKCLKDNVCQIDQIYLFSNPTSKLLFGGLFYWRIFMFQKSESRVNICYFSLLQL